MFLFFQKVGRLSVLHFLLHIEAVSFLFRGNPQENFNYMKQCETEMSNLEKATQFL